MTFAFHIVDAFTDEAYRGNPATVVEITSDVSDEWMQKVAREMNHSETAFVDVRGSDDEPKPLRWFTPTTEVDLCGHATLATAHALGGSQRFSTRSGLLTCNATNGWIEMDFPSDVPTSVEVPKNLAVALPNVTPLATAQSKDRLIVEIASIKELDTLVPDFGAFDGITTRGFVVTTRSESPDFDFASRYFHPQIGVPEDPATGSAHCTLAGWWAPKLDKTELMGEQRSERGGVIRMQTSGERVLIGGQAVTVGTGTLLETGH